MPAPMLAVGPPPGLQFLGELPGVYAPTILSREISTSKKLALGSAVPPPPNPDFPEQGWGVPTRRGR